MAPKPKSNDAINFDIKSQGASFLFRRQKDFNLTKGEKHHSSTIHEIVSQPSFILVLLSCQTAKAWPRGHQVWEAHH